MVLSITALLALASPPWHVFLGREYSGPPRTEAIASDGAKFYGNATVDHFVDNDDRVAKRWRQRYYEDLSLWGGASRPVFLALGGEGPTGPPGGLQRQLAATHGAALITLEHRFYGQSHPTPNMSAANLKLLSSEQALADAAQFIEFWNEAHSSLDSPWIAWGGSYSGQLASWLRLRYPASVAGAVAYSAPILSQVDFYSYNQVVTSVLASFGTGACPKLLEHGLTQLRSTLPTGRPAVAKLLHACKLPQNEDDDGVLLGSVQGRIQSLVQYNRHSTTGVLPGSVGSFWLPAL